MMKSRKLSPIGSGLGVSSGEVFARSFLFKNETYDPTFIPGTIIVARSTNNSMMANIMLASGIITETGSPLSHAAIIARELGIPCVVGIRDVLSIVQNDSELYLDGVHGVIYAVQDE